MEFLGRLLDAQLHVLSCLFSAVCVWCRTATKKQIVKAYRKLARQWHPDKFSEAEKEMAEKKFIDIAAAKEVLTDPG